jgi:DNA-binding MarR family transcriptional regulator
MFEAGKAIRASLRIDNKIDPATYAQLGVLRLLHDEGIMTMKKLAQSLSITPGSLTPLVDRLCLQGYLQRVPDKNDGRTIIIKITKDGTRAFIKHFRTLSRRMAVLFGKLSIQNQKRLIQVLEELQEMNKK